MPSAPLFTGIAIKEGLERLGRKRRTLPRLLFYKYRQQPRGLIP